jgi:prepilin peptidase CpaA
MSPVHALFSTLVALASIAAYTDLRKGIVPNRLVVLAFVCALPLQTWLEWPLRSETSRLGVLAWALGQVTVGALVCGLVPLVLFRLRAMGGGDVKLLAAVGALAGPLFGMEIELYAFVTAAVFAGAKLAYQGELVRVLAGSALLVVNPFLPGERRRPAPEALAKTMRFAPAVLVATLICVGVRWVLR